MAVISTRRRIQPAGVMMWWMMLLLLLIGTAATASSSSTRQVLFVAKNRQNPFFISAWEGCVETAHKLTLELQTNNKNNNNNIESEQEQARIECIFLGGDNGDDAQEQADLVRTYLLDLNTNNTNNTDSDTTILGMALSVIDIDTATSLIDEVVQDYNIPVVTYDSDAPDSLRHAYIGTDNWKFGNELAKLLLQLRPQGGVYGVISAQAPGVEERVRGLTDRFTNSIQQSSSVWKAAPNSPRYCQDNATLALQQSRQFAQEGVDAIIAVGGWPMYIVDGWERLALDYADNLTTVVGDAFDIQVRALRLGHVNALLGQMPFQMGQIVMTTLWDRHQTNTNGDDDDDDDDNSDIIYTTSFLEMLQVPLILPPLTVDLNYLGGLAGLGYFYLVVIWSLCIATVLWTFVRRQDKVVTASQPFFLYLVSGGTAIFGSAILPLTFDDEHHSQATMDRACMTTPWLLSLGFTLTFAALFSKTWRINQIFRNAQKFRRVVVTTKDVLLPLVILLVLNVAVLITWTIQAPLVYVRKAHEGTDPWNRVISTYGTCQVEEDHSSDGSLLQNDVLAYLILLAAINFGCLLMANYQAYAARSVQTEYSESKYIAFIMASNLQVAVVGVPVVFLVKDEPRSHFVVLSSLIFIMSTILLGFMVRDSSGSEVVSALLLRFVNLTFHFILFISLFPKCTFGKLTKKRMSKRKGIRYELGNKQERNHKQV